jgi:hypothetical protein
MIKYPDPVRGTKLLGQLSYKNNQYSEYIGCKIFETLGFKTQDVVLGTFTDAEGKDKIVVGCKIFTNAKVQLLEFKMLSNQEKVNDEKLGLDLNEVLSLIKSSRFIGDKETVISKFWDMFVVDALIGNRDRHLGNFGMLEKEGNLEFAPIYDCGSSLSALIGDDIMTAQQETEERFRRELKMIEYNVTSCFTVNGKKIFYHDIFKNPPDELETAIKRIVPKIDIETIYSIIDSTPSMPDVRKIYLNAAVKLRYEEILLPALNRVLHLDRMKSEFDKTQEPRTNHHYDNNTVNTKPSLSMRLQEAKLRTNDSKTSSYDSQTNKSNNYPEH